MLFDFIELDLNNKGKLYMDLYEKIKAAVCCDAIKVGEKLPSVRTAAESLNISRTTVENAYNRLCIEGIAESMPQRGYFIVSSAETRQIGQPEKSTKEECYLYDFSSRRIDTSYADTEIWKKLVRKALLNLEELTSYGDTKGERILRETLSAYTYKARGVKASPENIVIGAGIGPLINILCGLLGRDITVGFEKEGFKSAEACFNDYGIKTVNLESDNNGAKIVSVEGEEIDTLFLMPSALSRISVTSISKRRNEYVKWAEAQENRLIIEDDYNGELRYSARSLPAFQGKLPEKTVYIGSFSKLLLPSVRIAYMVLPDFLARAYDERKKSLNQTCGKIEQLALNEYILSKGLEKQLRRLRRLYYNKSQLLLSCLEKSEIPILSTTLYESSLTVEVATAIEKSGNEIKILAEKNGINLIESEKTGCLRLCFAGISEEEIPKGIEYLEKILKS